MNKNEFTLEQLHEVASNVSEISMLAVELFENDYNAAMRWMETPANFLFGMSPITVAVGGPDSLIKWMRDKLGKNNE